ncbi:MAG: Lrp/AsnC family transcriptional regulator [Myxococcales bacterium]|nr:Lrp/AsnC family transcriptional regulator [Myxococcales bacterium]
MEGNKSVALDEKDRAILRELQLDASISMAELADRVGLSSSPCWRRVKRLEDEGVVYGRVALVNPACLGLAITAFAMVSLDRHVEEEITAFHSAVQKAPEVISAHAVTGSVDFILTVLVPDMSAYEYFLRRHLLNLTMVRSVNTSFALRTIKASAPVPL